MLAARQGRGTWGAAGRELQTNENIGGVEDFAPRVAGVGLPPPPELHRGGARIPGLLKEQVDYSRIKFVAKIVF